MSNVKFDALPTVVNSNLADIICAIQGGVSSQETLQQIFTLMLANTILFHAGNPNSAVAGTIYQLCWDTTNLVMYVCTSSGNAATAIWTLSGSVVFPIPMAQGGSGAALTASNGGIIYTNATVMQVLAGTATAGQILRSGASSAPGWSTATYPATTTVNRLLYSSSSNVVADLATANSAMLVTNSTGVPAWTGSLTNGQLLIGSTGATPTAAAITAGSGISVTNGAGSITVATALTIDASTYTPTLTNVANLDGSTTYPAQYMRIGNVVTVSGQVDIDPTAATVSTQLGISLPIASNIANANECAGTAVSSNTISEAGAILGDPTNNRAQLTFLTTSTVNHPMYYTFTYLII